MKRFPAAAVSASALALALVVAGGRSDGATGNHEHRFFSARAGVGVEAPPGWNLSLHTGYANVLCLLVHPGGSRISLAVDATTAADAAALAAESRAGLAAQGIEVASLAPGPRGGVLVEAHQKRRNQQLRQLYLVRTVEGTPARQQIVLTLTTTPGDLASAAAALDWVIARLELETPVRPDDKHDRPDGGLPIVPPLEH
jgi:hypothetical protein